MDLSIKSLIIQLFPWGLKKLVPPLTKFRTLCVYSTPYYLVLFIHLMCRISLVKDHVVFYKRVLTNILFLDGILEALFKNKGHVEPFLQEKTC